MGHDDYIQTKLSILQQAITVIASLEGQLRDRRYEEIYEEKIEDGQESSEEEIIAKKDPEEDSFTTQQLELLGNDDNVDVYEIKVELDEEVMKTEEEVYVCKEF